MKNTLKKFAATLLFLVGFAGFAHAQTALNQTTLSQAQYVDAQAGSTSGITTGTYQTTVTLASSTGVTTAFNGQPVTIVYVDHEAEGILSLVTGTTYSVLRGQFGTKATNHASGAMVLFGVVTPQFAGFSGSGGLQTSDPPYGACTATNTLATPWVNMLTSYQWICSTITGTWVPGFNNPGNKVDTTIVASTAGFVTPSGPLFHISGTSAITGFTTPVGCDATTVGGCSFTVVPDAVFSWTAANNIAVASSALPGGAVVASHPIIFFWDAKAGKWEFIPGA